MPINSFPMISNAIFVRSSSASSRVNCRRERSSSTSPAARRSVLGSLPDRPKHHCRVACATPTCATNTSPNDNAVQLARLDDRDRWFVGLWPVGVSGSFDVPFGHFAFDQAWA